ncbi:MAG: AbrB/MazE/SpoVT family DNA-binding domain-containing protein, partial [archaeon GB-1867-035]|nr:AbrB/MazE/SpoVT family DNA-binding domain-containing protein [Candidatus Culexmicrobium profundum]
MDRYKVKVHRKGLIVIPAEIRRRFGICEGSHLELIVEGNEIRLIVPKTLK